MGKWVLISEDAYKETCARAGFPIEFPEFSRNAGNLRRPGVAAMGLGWATDRLACRSTTYPAAAMIFKLRFIL